MICLKKTITTQQRNPWNPFKFGACEEREFKSQKSLSNISFHSPEDKIQQSINQSPKHPSKVLKEMGKILSFLGESLQVQCVTIPNGTKLPHFDDFFANV
jgi:hypothetical protein